MDQGWWETRFTVDGLFEVEVKEKLCEEETENGNSKQNQMRWDEKHVDGLIQMRLSVVRLVIFFGAH